MLVPLVHEWSLGPLRDFFAGMRDVRHKKPAHSGLMVYGGPKGVPSGWWCWDFTSIKPISRRTHRYRVRINRLNQLWRTLIQHALDRSPTLISNVTDAVLDDVRDWQARPLSAVYPILYFDALFVKSRQGWTIKNKAV